MRNISVEVRDGTGALLAHGVAQPLQNEVELVTDHEISHETLLTATAVALNGVGLENVAAESLPVQILLSALNGGDAWLTTGQDLRVNSSFHTHQHGVSVAISGALDPMDDDADFTYAWAVLEAPCEAPLQLHPQGPIWLRSPSGELGAVAGVLILRDCGTVVL